jgi:alpha-galactosidase
MSITFIEDKKAFLLETCHSSYQMQVSETGQLLHLYYGTPTHDLMDYLCVPFDVGFSPNPYEKKLTRGGSSDLLPLEYSGQNTGDFRTASVCSVREDGIWGADFRYEGHEILDGKYSIKGMPSAFDKSGSAESLKILLRDEASGLEAELLYGVFEDEDMITRAVRLRNGSDQKITLEKAGSACLDLPSGDYDLIHFHGRHTLERQAERVLVMTGIETVSSKRGASSHQQNPFVILCGKNAGEEAGECFGMMLVYSGSHRFDIEKEQTGSVRVSAGIHEEHFSWLLGPGEVFETPEVLMTYSDRGLSALSDSYHRFIRSHICKSAYMERKRPVLINSWEACYFDFDSEKILDLAERAAELGIEMLVMDDGWFGKRIDDNAGLGDWYVNEDRLPGGLDPLIGKIRDMGLKFGIWVEPEMVNEDSDLYRAHPDWALTVPGRKPSVSRNQLVLDLSRPEVVDYLYHTLHSLLADHDIAYVKWDMNRHLTDLYSHSLPPKRQGEVPHRFMLGLYDLLERLTEEFPDVLFEGCSGGGGRFDAAMLRYFPQIWCSDDTDAFERLSIQEGTSYGYPISSVSAHVSAVPNHQTGRITPFGTRGLTAMQGSFGYELDLKTLTEEEKSEVRKQIADYHALYDLIQKGSYYRLTDQMGRGDHKAWEFVSRDRSQVMVSLVVTAARPCLGPIRIRLRGLLPEADYELVSRETFGCGNPLPDQRKRFTGAALMKGGYVLPEMFGSFPSCRILFKKV